MRTLPQVTLVCIDTINHELALHALDRCRKHLDFGRTLLFTDAMPPGMDVAAGIDVVTIGTLRSRDEYSRFVLKELVRHVTTTHALLVQWDGFVANAGAWDDAFLDADYIGARWFWYDDGMRVGNGGFSLRSRRLLEALQDPRIQLTDAEDITIGRTYRPLLEREHGIRFADEPTADRFAFEAAYPIGKPFGFHGLFNFCRVLTPDDLVRLAARFSDVIARSQQCAALLRNCLALGQWPATMAIARRMLAAEPAHDEAARALAQAEAAAARGLGIGRNDPCPCGSGKRYKQCHGSPDAMRRAAPASAEPPPDSRLVPAAAASAPATAAASADVLAATGVDAHRRNALAEAEQHYRAALASAPEHPLALHYLGVVLYQRNQLAEALVLLDRAADLVPDEPEFHNNRGLALAAARRVDDAVAAFRRTLALKPTHAGAHNNLGLALDASGEADAAIGAYLRALELDPQFVQAHWNLGLALLRQGRYAEGWREYEWRLRAAELKPFLRELPGKRWTGGDVAGRTLLLTAEQGLGDTLQNLRFAGSIAARGAHVKVAVQAPLVALAAGAPGVVEAVAIDGPLPAYDAHASLMSVPGVLGVTPETIATPVPLSARATGVARKGGDAGRPGERWPVQCRHRVVGRPRQSVQSHPRLFAQGLGAAAPNAGDALVLAAARRRGHRTRRRTIVTIARHAGDSQRFRRRCSAGRLARPRHQRGHEHRAPGRRAGPTSVRAAAFRRGLAVVARARGQPVVSDRSPVPSAIARRLDNPHRGHRVRAGGAHRRAPVDVLRTQEARQRGDRRLVIEDARMRCEQLRADVLAP